MVEKVREILVPASQDGRKGEKLFFSQLQDGKAFRIIAGAWISPILQEGKLRPGEMTDLLKVRARAGDGWGEQLVLCTPTLPPFIAHIISHPTLLLCNTIFLI